ncbi:MAG: hypothetical protein SCH71_05345 [Desulfobulbaceae bacterium]|nr:hypothetical protein [Desulfobulbaceae bacterium]
MKRSLPEGCKYFRGQVIAQIVGAGICRVQDFGFRMKSQTDRVAQPGRIRDQPGGAAALVKDINASSSAFKRVTFSEVFIRTVAADTDSDIQALIRTRDNGPAPMAACFGRQRRNQGKIFRLQRSFKSGIGCCMEARGFRYINSALAIGSAVVPSRDIDQDFSRSIGLFKAVDRAAA